MMREEQRAGERRMHDGICSAIGGVEGGDEGGTC